MIELIFQFKKDIKLPKYMQLYEYIKGEIQSGTLSFDTKMPSIMVLSKQLNVNKITVESAYHQLVSEGYLENKAKSGFYVQPIDVGFFPKQEQKSKHVRSHRSEKTKYQIDFDENRIDEEHFPISVWKKLSSQIFSQFSEEAFENGDPQGEWGLRHEIMSYLRDARGVKCSEDQIIIGANSQYLVFLLLQIIGNNKMTIGIQEPGYHLISKVFQDLGHTIQAIPTERDGLNIDKVKEKNPNLVFVSPSEQYPFGIILPIQKRIQLLEWAKKARAFIIEDDHLSEFRYRGNPIPSLQGLDREGRVIYMGTFFKSLLPSIRVGYMVIPESLLDEFRSIYKIYQQTTSRIHQKTIELFMKDGHWERHLLRMRKVYQKKYQTMIYAIEKYMKHHVSIIGEESGLHVVIKVKTNLKENELTVMAKDHGINIYSISDLWYDPANNIFEEPTFILGFGGLNQSDIEIGIKKLSEAWF